MPIPKKKRHKRHKKKRHKRRKKSGTSERLTCKWLDATSAHSVLQRHNRKAWRWQLFTKAPTSTTLALDTFYLEWDKQKRAVLAILDEFSRYEVDCEIKDETAEMEIGRLACLSQSGRNPSGIRRCFEWMLWTLSRWNLCWMGISPWHPHRAHTKRSTSSTGHPGTQSCSSKEDAWSLQAGDAWLHLRQGPTGHLPPERNRLSSVKGSTPATLAFGFVRGLDLAAKAQSPDNSPSLGGHASTRSPYGNFRAASWTSSTTATCWRIWRRRTWDRAQREKEAKEAQGQQGQNGRAQDSRDGPTEGSHKHPHHPETSAHIHSRTQYI